MKAKSRSFFTADRVLHLGGFVILLASAVISFFVEPESRTVIPAPGVVIPVVNSVSAACVLVQFFFLRKYTLSYIVLLVQGVATILTGYETLGIFLFIALIILLFCNGELKTHFVAKMLPVLGVWLASLFGLLPFGVFRFVLALTEAVFFASFYFCIYKKLEKLLVSIAPVFHAVRPSAVLPQEQGSPVSLAELGLNERQQNFIIDNLTQNCSYAELSEKYFVSRSTVKKEMADAFRIIGVRKLEELRLLLLQYEVKK